MTVLPHNPKVGGYKNVIAFRMKILTLKRHVLIDACWKAQPIRKCSKVANMEGRCSMNYARWKGRSLYIRERN